MRKSAALLLVFVFLTASCLIVAKPAVVSADVAEDSWVSKASMPTARSNLGFAVVNGKISISPIWLIAIAALVVIIIIELIIYFLLKGKKSKS